MLSVVYCDRSGCGKEVGAQRIENGKVVEEEYEEGTVAYTPLVDGLPQPVEHYCCQECFDKRKEFLGPEEIEDE